MKRILITGSTGFVGRQIMKALADKKVCLLPVVRTGESEIVANLPKVERVVSTTDLFSESPSWWERTCKGVDIVVHVAWYVEPGVYLNSPRNMECLVGSLNLARGATNAGITRFVGVGTCFEYDLTKGRLSVQTPLKPNTAYAAAKAALYLGLDEWLPIQSVDFAWCRLFYLFGQGEHKRRLVPYVRNQIQKGEPVELTQGKQVRDFLDVAEAGKQIADVVLGQQIGALNVCSGTPVTVRKIAEKIADEYGRRDLLRFGARPERANDPAYVVGVPSL